MSTSVQVAYNTPTRQYQFSRNACFGEMNRMHQNTENMEVMEWHPETAGNENMRNAYTSCTPRTAMNFVNSFGMWENLFWLTSINTVACDLATTPADAMITGFMTMRDFQHANNTRLFENFEISNKIEFALWSSGIYRDRYGSTVLSIQPPSHGESGVCYLNANNDAIGLYLLVFGNAADFSGCWAQGAIGRTPATRQGYVRNSSDSTRISHLRRDSGRNNWSGLASWISSWLAIRPEHLRDRMGRLTVQQFYDRLVARLRGITDKPTQASIINESFDQLRDFYS